LVEFYSPICGACKNFAREYAKIGEYFRNLIPVGRLNIHPEEHQPILTEYDITAVPHITLFLPSQNKPIHFEETRTPLSIATWAISYLPVVIPISNNIDSISLYLCSHDSLEVFPSRFLQVYRKNQSDMSMVVTYRYLAEAKHRDAVFAEVEVSGIEVELNELFNVSSYPGIIVLKALSGSTERYGLYYSNWAESLKEFWEDIDSSVLFIIESRKHFFTLGNFSILFFLINNCYGVSVLI